MGRIRGLGAVVSKLLVAAVPAALLGIYALRPAHPFVLTAALVPWVVLYTDPRRPRTSIAYYAVGAWLAWQALYPQARTYGVVAAIVMGTACWVFWLPFAPALRALHARFDLPRTLTVPVVWVAVEWVRATFTVGHFDLYALGYSRARFPVLIQIAEITGVYGVSFLVAAANGFLADVAFAVRDAGGRAGSVLRDRRVRLAGAALVAMFAVVVAYGTVRLGQIRVRPGPSVALVQPNILHSLHNVRGTQLAQLILTDEKVPVDAADLIVWPENAVLDVLSRNAAYLDDLRWIAGRKSSWVLVGALGQAPGAPGRTTNRAFLFDEDGRLRGDYAKQILFPWSERIPLDDWLARSWPWLWRTHRALVRNAWGYVPTGVPGRGTRVLTLDSDGTRTPFACLICNENAYPPLAAAAAAKGARFLINITSEGNLGGPVQEQLLRISILRAVENRVAYVRDGNTGISGFIDPAGRVRSVLRGRRGLTNDDDGVLVDQVALAPEPSTLYARSRDAFAKGCVLAVLIGLTAALVTSRARARLAVVAAASALTAGCADVPRIGTDAAAAPAALERLRTLVRDGRDAEALRLAGDACATEAACREALPPATDAFRRTARFEPGAAFLDAVGRRHPGLAGELHLYRGILLRGALDDARAEGELRAAVARTPSVRAYAALGGLLVDDGRPEEAVETLRRGAAFEPSSVPLRVLLGRALLEVRRSGEAREVLERAAADAPGNSAAWTELGAVLLDREEDDAARAALERALAADPEEIEARRLLGALALRRGAAAEARRRLEEVASLEAALVARPAGR